MAAQWGTIYNSQRIYPDFQFTYSFSVLNTLGVAIGGDIGEFGVRERVTQSGRKRVSCNFDDTVVLVQEFEGTYTFTGSTIT